MVIFGVWDGGTTPTFLTQILSLTPFFHPLSDRGARGDQQHREEDGGFEALRGDGTALLASQERVWGLVWGRKKKDFEAVFVVYLQGVPLPFHTPLEPAPGEPRRFPCRRPLRFKAEMC